MPETVRFMYSCLKWAKLRNFQWMMLSSSKPYKVTFGVETWRRKYICTHAGYGSADGNDARQSWRMETDGKRTDGS